MNLIIDVKSRNPYNYYNFRKIIFLQYLPISIGLVDQMGTCFDRLRYWNFDGSSASMLAYHKLQQYLPFTVLKRNHGILHFVNFFSCNSAYRLRYAPKGARQQRNKATMRSAHLKYLSKAKVKRRWWSNSTYCLRYAPQSVRHQRSKATMRPTHRKYLSEAKVKRRW